MEGQCVGCVGCEEEGILLRGGSTGKGGDDRNDFRSVPSPQMEDGHADQNAEKRGIAHNCVETFLARGQFCFLFRAMKPQKPYVC